MSLALQQLSGRHIAILGLGREGLSTYHFLRQHWPNLPLLLADHTPLDQLAAEVRQIGQRDPAADFFTGESYLELPPYIDTIFRSPGIPPDLPPLAAARQRGVLVTSNTRLFFDLQPGTVIGITGTKGKSTTAALIAAVLRGGGLRTHLLGNIGVPPLSVLADATAESFCVAELSSYQLADLHRSPSVAVLLNIVPEHLSYHGTFEAYVEAKNNLLRHQTEHDTLIFNAAYALPAQLARQSRAHNVPFSLEPATEARYYAQGDWLVYGTPGSHERIIPIADVPLAGRFNLQNVLPALAVGRLYGVPSEAIAAAVRAFRPLEHRLEFVAQRRDIRFYNDSLSTVPEATLAAIDALAPAPVVLIAGGHDRGLDYSDMARELSNRRIRALVLFPPTGDRLWQALQALNPANLPPSVRVETMAAAVEHSWALAQTGDVVLLSPASTSFAQFRDYRDRGEQFKAQVHQLLATHSEAGQTPGS